ncbi:hypothetical protein DSC45_30930 [Streptomyces sp. YIM 130001]|uniref:hypothetical protein n=1 Tax=Streptomyces sp. YIM 130001 TaxID=2259644 RepID=UPI000E650E7C|nr:hypothetical protein [Streptomyces sp. YIM 130001]RII09497.1 hypothetical protein DSC45_30930 [Streptomyces sp. YIM 130001]
MAGRSVRWRVLGALGLGLVWWWAVLRVVFVPEAAGVLEGAVAAGGWGLSLLPVHCVPRERAAGVRRAVTSPGGKPREAIPAGEAISRGLPERWRGGVTRAWRRRRWGGRSGPS